MLPNVPMRMDGRSSVAAARSHFEFKFGVSIITALYKPFRLWYQHEHIPGALEKAKQ
jgi:hypothetical protein